jgi:hypothetical protein
MSDRLLRTRDVADLLDVSCETVLRWHRSGKLLGGRRLGSNVLRFSRGAPCSTPRTILSSSASKVWGTSGAHRRPLMGRNWRGY